MHKKRRGIIDKIDDIEGTIDKTFDDLVSDNQPMWDPQLHYLEPLAYLNETKDKFIITIDLPFVRKEDIALDVTPEEFTIEAKMQKCITYDKWGTVQRKCRFQHFIRKFKIPIKVDPEKTRARFRQGFLILDLPKKIQKNKITIE